MKKNITLIALAILLAGLSNFWLFRQTQAQIDSFTFFIPFRTDVLDDHFNAGHAPLNLIDDDIETTISIAIQKSNTRVNFDHWEDGPEADLTSPVQPSSEIWGDGNAANGIPPGFGLTDADDVLISGDIIVLTNTVTLPRDPATLFFDGGDILTSVGGAVAVTLAVWPIHAPAPPTIGPLYAGAWELYPTNRWGQEYTIPIGEDLAAQRAGFTIVTLNVQAVLDNTTVTFNPPGGPITTAQLNRGEQLTTPRAATNIGLKITADAPIQVHVFAANPASTYEARAYTIIPEPDWSDDLLAPRSSDGDFWLYNPDNNPLPITVTSFTSTTTITIPARSTTNYPPTGLSAATGLRFTSDDGRPFYGLAAIDETDAQDWGYTLLPVKLLAAQTLIGWAPGNNNKPPGPVPTGSGNESPVYVTAATTATLILDYKNDPPTLSKTFTITPLHEIPITDPHDFDMTGAFLSTVNRTPFLAVWGQAENAPPALPSIDVGTSIVPLPDLGITKVAGPLHEDVDCTGTITLDDILQYTLTYYNNTLDPVTAVNVEDFLSPDVEYVPNSAKVIEGPSLGPVPDAGASLFPLDEGGLVVGDLPILQSGSIVFDVRITGSTDIITNTAKVRSLDIPLDVDSAVTHTPLVTKTSPLYQIDKTLVAPTNGIVSAGDLVTYTVAITNSSPMSASNTITNFTLQETYNDGYLTFRTAIPTPTVTATGVITWSDLTTTFGDLVPGATFNLTIAFEVAATPASPITITNVTSGIQPARSDGTLLPTCRDRATLHILPALLGLQKTFQPLTNLSCTRSVNLNDIIQFRLDYENPTPNLFTNVFIEDNLSSAITYISNSTLLNGVPIPDDDGATPFPLDEGGYNIGQISTSQTGFLTFEAQVNNTAAEIKNRAEANSADLPPGSNLVGSGEVVVFTPPTAITEQVVVIDIELIDPPNGFAASGDVARFAVEITNTSAVTITTLHLEDIFEQAHLTFRSADPPPRVEPGLITWDDLTRDLGDLPPGETFNLSITFDVGPIPANVTNTANRITLREAMLSDGTNIQACGANANLGFYSSTPTPTSTPYDDERNTPTPSSSQNVTPPAALTTTPLPFPSPLPTSTVFPVVLLPETGYRPAIEQALLSLIVLVGLGIWVISRLNRRRRR